MVVRAVERVVVKSNGQKRVAQDSESSVSSDEPSRGHDDFAGFSSDDDSFFW